MSTKSKQNLMMYVVIITMVAIAVMGMVTLYGYHIRDWFITASFQNVQPNQDEGKNNRSVGVEPNKGEPREDLPGKQ